MKIKYTKVIQITLFYILGIITGLVFPNPLISILVTAFFIALLFFLNNAYRIVFILSFVLGLGNVYLAVNKYFSAKTFFLNNNNHDISGEIISYPVRSKFFSKFLFRIDKIDNKKGEGIIHVFIKPYIKIDKNYHLDLYGKINLPNGPANFGEFDNSLYYEKSQINGTLFINNINQIKKNLPVKKYSLSYFISVIRDDIKNYIKKYYHSVQGTFLSGIIIGETANIPSYINDIFIWTGTIHLLSISGLHVGLITLIVLTIFINLRIPRKTAFIFILIFVILYNLIVGYKAPILRASLMFMGLVLCYLFDRDRNYLNSIFLSGLVILLIDPLAIQSISFQLSFLATIGIIIYSSVISESMDKYIPIKKRGIHFIVNNFTMSLASQVLIFPILMFNFQQFAYTSFLTNLVAIPLTTIILFLSLFAYFFFHVIPILTLFLTKVSDFIIALMIYSLDFFIKIPLLKFEFFNYKLVFLYYFILFLLSIKIFIKGKIPYINSKKIRYSLVFLLSVLFVFICIIIQKSADQKNDTQVEIIFFNIKGKSVLIKTSLNKYILIDSGYDTDFKTHILPFFKRNKINQIDYLFLSNITKARSQGVPYLLNEIPVKYYMDSGCPVKEFRYERIMEIVREKKIKYQCFTAGDVFVVDDITFYIINPFLLYLENFKNDKSPIENNSLVLKLNYKNKSILFCSDIQKTAVEFITLKQKKILKADIINLPDFNRDNNILSMLFKYSKPYYTIINSSFSYLKNKDKEGIIRIFKPFPIENYCTKDDGAIKIIINKNDCKIITSFKDKSASKDAL